jgi:hypothetical protein
MPISSALNNRCQGAAAFLSNAGILTLIAGDSNRLYRLTKGQSYAWADISGATYTIDPTELWEFDHFNGAVIACNINDPIQTFNLDNDSKFSNLSGSPPKTRHVSVIKNSFVMLGYTSDPVFGVQPQRVWWCGAGNASSWPTPGSVSAAQVQSGYVDLFGDEGFIQSIRSGLLSADGLVMQQYGARRAIYSGPPTVFQFLPTQNSRGTPAPHSPVAIGGIVYLLCWDGWYSCDGMTFTPIGVNKVDKAFFADVNPLSYSYITGVYDPVTRMIWWAYAGQGSDGVTANRLIGYNPFINRWAPPAEVTAQTISRMISIGYTLDELWTVLGYTLDTLPAPLDSPVWAGGSLIFGLFDASNKLNYLSGPALPAIVETQEMEPAEGRRTLITNTRPLIDGTGTGAPSVIIGHREALQDPVQYTAASPRNKLGSCPLRSSGRYVRARVSVGAGGDWTNISGVELEQVAQGKR